MAVIIWLSFGNSPGTLFGAEPPYAAALVPDEARRQPEDGGQGRMHDGAHPLGGDDGQDPDVYGAAVKREGRA